MEDEVVAIKDMENMEDRKRLVLDKIVVIREASTSEPVV